MMDGRAICSLHRSAARQAHPSAKVGLVLTVKTLTHQRRWPKFPVRRTRSDRLPPSQRVYWLGSCCVSQRLQQSGRPVAVTAASDQFTHHLGASAVANPPMAPDILQQTVADLCSLYLISTDAVLISTDPVVEAISEEGGQAQPYTLVNPHVSL